MVVFLHAVGTPGRLLEIFLKRDRFCTERYEVIHVQEVLVFDMILRIAQCNGRNKATDLVMAPGSPDRASACDGRRFRTGPRLWRLNLAS